MDAERERELPAPNGTMFERRTFRLFSKPIISEGTFDRPSCQLWRCDDEADLVADRELFRRRATTARDRPQVLTRHARETSTSWDVPWTAARKSWREFSDTLPWAPGDIA